MHTALALLVFLLLFPAVAQATADKIMGVDSTTGVSEAMDPVDAATLIGASTSETLATVTGRGNTSTGNDESNPFEILGTGGQASYGWSIDQTSGGEGRIRCKTSAGLNKCNQYHQIDDTYEGGYKDKDGTKRLTIDGTTGAMKNVSLDCTDATNVCTITETHWSDAAACQNGSASLVWNVPTSNAPQAVCDPDSTPNAYASFDATTDESFDFDIVLPAGFVSIDFHYIWKAAATSGAAGWCAQLVRVPDGTTSGQTHAAQASGNCVSDTAKGTTLQENRADKTGVTCTSCAAGDRVKGRISRDANGGAVTDDMTGDAHLIKYGYTITRTH